MIRSKEWNDEVIEFENKITELLSQLEAVKEWVEKKKPKIRATWTEAIWLSFDDLNKLEEILEAEE